MKRGFTLIEMLGILVILSVIILVSLPSIIQTNRNAKQSELEDAEKTILMAAETYLGISDVASNSLKKNNYYYIKLTTLVSEGLLPNNMKNPHPDVNLDNTISEGNYWVEVRINNGETKYTLVNNNPYEGEISDSELAYNILLEKGEVVRDKLQPAINRYVYANSNPNNYVRFNNQTWRIVALESDKTIKIVRDDFLENMGLTQSEQNVAFGSASTVNSSTLINTYLNTYYYDNNLTPSAQNMIVQKAFPSGTITLSSLSSSSNINTLETATTYATKIGLLSPSDYINASANTACSAYASYSNTADVCSESNYLVKGERWWLMHADSTGLNLVVNPTSSNEIDNALNSDCTSKGKTLSDRQKNYAGLNNYPSVCLAKVRPAVYLTKDITITSGNGNSTSPYVFASL